MNTKQKLTLGIAAIFMVTLTIIGVTYAYFVTRVNYTGTETTAVIRTAEIGSSINPGDEIVLDNAIPGQSVWKSFAVNTGSEADVPFAIKITTSLNVDEAILAANQGTEGWTPNVATDAYPEFIHTTLTDADCAAAADQCYNQVSIYPQVGKLTGTCYMSDEAAMAYTGKETKEEARELCFDNTAGTRYNNIELTLYRVHSNQSVIDESGDLYYSDRVYGIEFADGATAEQKKTAISNYGYFYEGKVPSNGEPIFKQFSQEIFNAEEVPENNKIKKQDEEGREYEAGKTVMLKKVGDGGVTDLEVAASVVFDESVKPAFNVLPQYAEGVLAPYNRSFISSGNAINIGGTQVVRLKKEKINEDDEDPINSYNLYVLKVTYKNLNINQNLENNASVNIKIDITGDATVSQ